MKSLRKFFEFPSFYSLTLIFAIIGSCLIFFPPIVPAEQLKSIVDFFPFPRPYLVDTLLDAMASLGIEFYGGAILSFAFGVIDEKEGNEKKTQQDKFQSHLFFELDKLDKKISELSAIIDKQSNSAKVSQSMIRKNHWLWSILFG